MKPGETSPLVGVEDGAVQPGAPEVERPSRPDDTPHQRDQRFGAFDRLPALLTPAQLCALLPYGRSWFWEHERAGAFREFEVRLAGKRFYSGRLLALHLKLADVDNGELQQPIKFFRRTGHAVQRRSRALTGPREKRGERRGEDRDGDA